MAKNDQSSSWHKRTQAVHAGTRRSQYGELSEALFLTQAFDYPSQEAAAARFEAAEDDAFIYARYGNPTLAMFEDRLAAIEGAEAGFATASGMAAVNAALFALLKAGDHVVASRALFGSCDYICTEILPRFGVEVTQVDGRDLTAWQSAIRPDTKLVFFESLSNPCLELVDIEAVAKLAHAVGAYVVVDHAFASPVWSQTIAQGADLVVYSATKHIDGQGRALGGALLGKRDLVRGPIETYLKHTGGAMSPFTAWIMLKGLETLDLRVRAQTETATKLARFLDTHDGVAELRYPGLPSHPQHALAMRQMGAGGTMIALRVKGGREAAFHVINALQIARISNNLGDAKSIVTHPATTTHQRMPEATKQRLGITEDLLRFSCGLEDADDLIADFQNALAGLDRGASTRGD